MQARSFSFGKLGNSPNDRASHARFPHRRIASLSAQALKQQFGVPQGSRVTLLDGLCGGTS
ncbi:MAG: hypothetical protein LC674_05495, partial [Actinobacteria bacterium]|nr:hypothetical protein [Actinomycetota bacterium]